MAGEIGDYVPPADQESVPRVRYERVGKAHVIICEGIPIGEDMRKSLGLEPGEGPTHFTYVSVAPLTGRKGLEIDEGNVDEVVKMLSPLLGEKYTCQMFDTTTPVRYPDDAAPEFAGKMVAGTFPTDKEPPGDGSNPKYDPVRDWDHFDETLGGAADQKAAFDGIMGRIFSGGFDDEDHPLKEDFIREVAQSSKPFLIIDGHGGSSLPLVGEWVFGSEHGGLVVSARRFFQRIKQGVFSTVLVHACNAGRKKPPRFPGVSVFYALKSIGGREDSEKRRKPRVAIRE